MARSGKPYAIARFPFAGDRPGDLSFGQGDLVELVEVVGSGWLRGRIRDTEGIFPGKWYTVLLECIKHLRTLVLVDQFATIKSTKPKLLLVNTHDPCQNAIVRSQRVNFSADWLIRKGFSPAKYSVVTVLQNLTF